MDNRTKVVTNQMGEVVFVGTHMECSRWLLDTYPGPFKKRIKTYEASRILPGIFRIQTLEGEGK